MTHNIPAHKRFVSSSSDSVASFDCENTFEFVSEVESSIYEMVSYVGQLFSKLEEVENFYESYAQNKWF